MIRPTIRVMPIYVYETVTADGAPGERFELSQRMSEAALTHHPVSGAPVRRVISGGIGLINGRAGRNEGSSAPQSGHTHGPGCGHGH